LKYRIGEKGLTLIEIAIVMVIMGILIAIGASMLGPLTKRAKQLETNTILDAAVDAVVAYATTNKKLPVWTDGNDLTLSPNEFHYIIRNRNDAWGSPLFYRFADGISPYTVYPDLSASDICAATATNLAITRCSDALCTVPQVTRDIAFIVYSPGPNRNYQTILPGYWPPPPILTPPTLPAPYPAGIYTAYVYDQDITMGTDRVSSPPNIPVPNTNPLQTIADMSDNGCASNEDRCRYDDIVKYMTLTELKTKIGCTKYDFCSAGITIANQSLGPIYYKLNGVGCATWNNATNIALTPTNSYQLFTDVACATACLPQSYMTFSQQKDIDVNNNCLTKINPGCQMVDQ
jgi:prepilin-type N-terminal cleavage/methylation domain-containing protein